MKIVLFALPLFAIQSLYAQDKNFEQTVRFIQTKIDCCSVPFAASTTRKVAAIAITKNGDVTLFYSDKKPKQAFNIFSLYKGEGSVTGIDTVMAGKFIQFYAGEKKIRMIRFATRADAAETFTAVLRLFSLCSNKAQRAELNFEQTVDLINNTSANWLQNKNGVTIAAQKNGDISIANNRNQFFRFNLFELKGDDNNISIISGIEIDTCDTKTHAPSSWINFYTSNGQIAFMRFDCKMPKAKLEIIREAFFHLKSLCKKEG